MTKNDALAAEAATAMPAGVPELRPLVALDRPTRAKVLRSMATILPKLEGLRSEPLPDDPAAPARTAGKTAWTAHAKQLGVEVPRNATKPQIQAAVDEHRAANRPERSVAERLEEQATIVELAADLEPLVCALAVDEESARAWCTSASDVEVIAAVLAYQQGAQPGEASRSSS
jgi:hypothetical protein